mmetsp:Transcript_13954/g.44318  ORF Transcript_13954/g.44318 Transcript_13954/m.44318 type:complete len:212 (-) Transcript_13954:37-672(-)
MLAADKLVLQSEIRKNSVHLKSKELQLHNENFQTVGTQAAVLAGFAVVALVELEVPETCWWPLAMCFNLFTMMSLAANLRCVSYTAMVQVWGCTLAMRGPDGSMFKAVEGMYKERKQIFSSFGMGIIATHFSGIFAGWVKMRPEAAFVATLFLLYSLATVVMFYRRSLEYFKFSEDDVTSFEDIFIGNINWSIPSVNMDHMHEKKKDDRNV